MTELFVKSLIILYGLTTLLLLPERVNAEDYYQKTKAYRVEPDSDPSSYVRNLSKTQFAQFRDIEWLDVGLDFRTRYEYRENDLRRRNDATTGAPLTRYRNDPDNLWLLRTRAYLGVKKILDPLRFAVEFEDSRSYNGLYEKTNADVNEFELIQGYGELYFDHLLGHNRPLSLRVGRQALELIDRRLIASNQFRNTTNNFEGFRLRFGKKQNNWDLDTFAFQPVERSKYGFDQPDQATWFYGAVFSLKQWSEYLTIQPYFIGRKQRAEPFAAILTDRKAALDIYAPGVRAYGVLADTGVDFDADLNKQFGRSGSLSATDSSGQLLRQHDALAYSLELGYSFDHDWKPRASVYYGYGTGDKNPSDNINNRFDAFYGFNQPWSRNDYFSWDNIHAPKARLEFSPNKNLRFDMGYNLYWVQSATDAWNRANLRDRSGQSGQFLGHEFDLRMLHKLNAYVDWSVSYARFTPGDFTKSFNQLVSPTDGPFTTEASNFVYVEMSLNAFGDGKP